MTGTSIHTAVLKGAVLIQEPLITTLPVVTDVCYLLQSRRGQRFALGFLRSHQRGAFRIFEMGESHIVRSEELMREYAKLPMDFADASLVIWQNILGLAALCLPTSATLALIVGNIASLLRICCCFEPAGIGSARVLKEARNEIANLCGDRVGPP
jgi:predicted nucleic acid-binding protein